MYGSLALSPYNSWDLNSYSQYTGLGPYQIQELQNVFNQQAAATGGRLGVGQFQNLFSNVNGLNWNLGGNYQQNFLPFDLHGDGLLNFNQFLAGYLASQNNVSPVQRWTYLANNYQLSQPGHLSEAEAQLLLNNMQRFYNFPLQPNYFQTAWSQAGSTQGGYVPISNFLEAVFPLIPETYIW